MKKTIAEFSIEYLQILDENARVDKKLMPSISSAQIKKMYEIMILTRMFDEKAVKMQRQGRLGTYAQVKGQEACQIPATLLMQKQDIAFPAFREHALFLGLGFPPETLYQAWGGDERAMKVSRKYNLFPISVPVGSHLLHAVGAARAFQLQKKKAISLVFFGEGATSEGDCLEAFNFAGIFKAPIVFFCQNNQYAISVPRKEQTAAKTLAQKAIAFGFQGIQVDGNDIFAMYKATLDAFKKAREGKGPTLIECYTYRLGDHTTSDDAKKYRKESEVSQWEKKGPILRLEKYMKAKKIAKDSYFKSVKTNAEKIIFHAVEEYESLQPPPQEDIFNYLYEKPTQELKEQLIKFKEDQNKN